MHRVYELLLDLADDAEAAAKKDWGWPNIHPANQHKFDRDMGSVREARELVEKESKNA